MRSDLGRLAAIAEILQVRSVIADGCAGPRQPWRPQWSRLMRRLRAAAMVALLAGPAYAEMPNVNLIPEIAHKSAEEKEQDQVREKAYRESLRKIPDAKGASDPWGNVRGADAPKPVKPASKTGHNAK